VLELHQSGIRGGCKPSGGSIKAEAILFLNNSLWTVECAVETLESILIGRRTDHLSGGAARRRIEHRAVRNVFRPRTPPTPCWTHRVSARWPRQARQVFDRVGLLRRDFFFTGEMATVPPEPGRGSGR
jgi:hypothetical protein